MTASASRPFTDLTIPDVVKRRACQVYDAALLDEDNDHHGWNELDDHAEIRALLAVAPAVVAQFLRDLAAVHDRVSGGLLAELADGLDPQAGEDGANQ